MCVRVASRVSPRQPSALGLLVRGLTSASTGARPLDPGLAWLCLLTASCCCQSVPSLTQALLTGGDQRPGQHRSQHPGRASGGRAAHEPAGAVRAAGARGQAGQ